MAYQGDIKAARVLRFTFSTVNTSGAPTQLAGTPAISVYKDASTTQSTTGVTLTVDYDTVTGLNHVAIDTSADGTFYSAGSDFAVVITTGTVGGTSVVGYTVGTFSIENRVINWAQIGSPTTTVNLSGTTVKTATDVETDTADIQSRIPAALVSGRMDSSVGAMAANTLTAAATASDFTTEIQTGLATAADLATVAGYLDTEIAAILADTNELQTDWANGGRLDLILDARASQTSVDDIPTNAELTTALAAADDAVLAAIAALNNLSAAQVNAEVVDALATDTYAEPGQGSPAATTTIAAKIGYLYKAWRNRTTQTATEYALYADNATTKDQEAAVSDDGTTFERGEVTTGA